MVEVRGKPQTRRLFLALWPNPSERKQISDLARSLAGGRNVKAENLHLTLVFLGTTDSQRQQCYEQALQDIPKPSFVLTLDTLGYWPKPRILWLGTSQSSTHLVDLVRELRERLTGCGFEPERRPFKAHVTLARRFPGPAPEPAVNQPIIWPVSRVALVESCSKSHGIDYHVLRYWPGD